MAGSEGLVARILALQCQSHELILKPLALLFHVGTVNFSKGRTALSRHKCLCVGQICAMCEFGAGGTPGPRLQFTS